MLEPGMLSMLAEGTWQSIYMTVAITAISYLIGIPLGVFLVMSDKNGIHPMASLNWIVGGIVNILRSVPFLILMITIQPFTRMIVGTTIGTPAPRPRSWRWLFRRHRLWRVWWSSRSSKLTTA